MDVPRILGGPAVEFARVLVERRRKESTLALEEFTESVLASGQVARQAL